jgi:hypothetical protein
MASYLSVSSAVPDALDSCARLGAYEDDRLTLQASVLARALDAHDRANGARLGLLADMLVDLALRSRARDTWLAAVAGAFRRADRAGGPVPDGVVWGLDVSHHLLAPLGDLASWGLSPWHMGPPAEPVVLGVEVVTIAMKASAGLLGGAFSLAYRVEHLADGRLRVTIVDRAFVGVDVAAGNGFALSFGGVRAGHASAADLSLGAAIGAGATYVIGKDELDELIVADLRERSALLSAASSLASLASHLPLWSHVPFAHYLSWSPPEAERTFVEAGVEAASHAFGSGALGGLLNGATGGADGRFVAGVEHRKNGEQAIYLAGEAIEGLAGRVLGRSVSAGASQVASVALIRDSAGRWCRLEVRAVEAVDDRERDVFESVDLTDPAVAARMKQLRDAYPDPSTTVAALRDLLDESALRATGTVSTFRRRSATSASVQAAFGALGVGASVSVERLEPDGASGG